MKRSMSSARKVGLRYRDMMGESKSLALTVWKRRTVIRSSRWVMGSEASSSSLTGANPRLEEVSDELIDRESGRW